MINIIQRIKRFFKDLFSCPLGWEDDDGFHYGTPPKDKRIHY